MTILANHMRRVYGFSPAVRRLLAFTIYWGLGHAVWSLLFSLYLKQAGFREDFIGDLNFIMAMMSAVSAPVAGFLSTRVGHRSMLLAGAGLELLSMVALIWFPQPAVLVVAMGAIGAAFAFWLVPFNPFMAENSRPEERVYIFSTVNMIWLGTGMGGSIVGGWLPGLMAWLGLADGAESLHAYRLAITSGIALYVPALALLVRLKSGDSGTGPGHIRVPLRPLPPGTLPLLRIFLVVSVLFGMSSGSFFPFVSLYFKQHLAAPPELVGLVVGSGQAAGVLGLLLAAPLAHRFGKVRAVALVQMAAMPCLLGMAAATNLLAGTGAYLARYVIWNMGTATFDAFQMEVVPDRLRAALNALAGIPTGVGFNLAYAVAGALGGRLIVGYGYPSIFVVAVGFSLLGTTLYFLRFRNQAALGPD